MAASPQPLAEPVPADPGRLVAAHEQAALFYRDQLRRADGPRQYLTRRGLRPLIAPDLPWRIGYAPPGWTALRDHLTAAGFAPAELHAAGLATHSRTGQLVDTFRDRVVLPIRDPAGRTVAFIGRAAPSAGPAVPKYLNSPDTAIYRKGLLLYGLAEQHRRFAAGWAPVLVEGPFDVLAIWLAYPPGAGTGRAAVSACGIHLTAAHARAIRALPAAASRGVTVAFDSDPAGTAATDRAFQVLGANPGGTLYGAALPAGTDPADLVTHPDRTAALRAALSYHARPLAELVIEHRIAALVDRHPGLLAEPPGRIAAVRAAAGVLATVPPREAARLLPYVAEVTGTGIDTVTWAVLDAYHADDTGAADGRG